MAKAKERTSVYLSDELLRKIRTAKEHINVSEVCQNALWAELEKIGADRHADIAEYFECGGAQYHFRDYDSNEICLYEILQQVPYNVFREFVDIFEGVDIDAFGDIGFPVMCMTELDKPLIIISSAEGAFSDKDVLKGALIKAIAFWWLRTHTLLLPANHKNSGCDSFTGNIENGKAERRRISVVDDAVEKLILSWGDELYKFYEVFREKQLKKCLFQISSLKT